MVAKHKALLVAIDDYGDPRNNLSSCINDSKAFEELLKAEYGFSPDMIHVLRNEAATPAHVDSELEWLCKDASAEDRLIFFYSGHGYQVSGDGPGEAGILEEVLVLSGPAFYRDDRLAKCTRDLPPGVLTVICDSCYSGGMEKVLQLTEAGVIWGKAKCYRPTGTQVLEAEAVPEIPRKLKSFGGTTAGGMAALARQLARGGSEAPIPPPTTDEPDDLQIQGLMLSACLETEVASAQTRDTKGLSAFTFALLEAVRERGAGVATRDLLENSQHRLRRMGFRQTPLCKERRVADGIGARSFILLESSERPGGVAPSYEGSGHAILEVVLATLTAEAPHLVSVVLEALRKKGLTDQGGGELQTAGTTRTTYVTGMSFTNKAVTYSVIDGDAIFEGDIVLGTEAEMEQARQRVESPDEAMLTKGVAVLPQLRWPNGVIPYTIDSSLTNQQRVTDAIRNWEQNTNVRFRLRTNETDYVTFRPGTGCSANVGRRGGQQWVNLGAGCTLGNTIHEIGHTVGLWHEQSREDRDRFVTIDWDNIETEMRHNFNQHVSDGDDIARYDYGSIMHYPSNAFAIDASKPTIIAPEPIGQRDRLSATDIRVANFMYPRKTTLSDTSGQGPALATVGNTLLLGWTGTGNTRLNFMRSTDGASFTGKVTLGETSPAALGLASFQNQYFVAWIGTGNNRLNIMRSQNGASWTNKVTLGDTSRSAPALVAFGGWLYLAWRGVGNNRLNVMRSRDGMTWMHKVTLGDTSESGPTLCALPDRLLLGWRGVGNNFLNVLRSFNGTSFGGKVTLGDTSLAKPYLHFHDGEAYLAWQGVGNRWLNLMASRDSGATWGGKLISSETCIDGPVLGTLGGRMVWGWTGTNAARNLNTGLI